MNEADYRTKIREVLELPVPELTESAREALIRQEIALWSSRNPIKYPLWLSALFWFGPIFAILSITTIDSHGLAFNPPFVVRGIGLSVALILFLLWMYFNRRWCLKNGIVPLDKFAEQRNAPESPSRSNVLTQSPSATAVISVITAEGTSN
jgi:hypothetical protein